MRHSGLVWAIFGLLLFSSLPRSAVAQSLGEVAAAERAKKKSTHKIYDNENLGVSGRAQSANDTVAASCDANCETQLQSELKNAMRTPIGGPEWEAMFADGLSAMKDDTEWQDLYSRVRNQVCTEKHNKADAVDPRPLIKELLTKVMSERREVEELTVQAMSEPRSTPEAQANLRALRTKAIKLGIMGIQLKNLPSAPCDQAKAALAVGQNH